MSQSYVLFRTPLPVTTGRYTYNNDTCTQQQRRIVTIYVYSCEQHRRKTRKNKWKRNHVGPVFACAFHPLFVARLIPAYTTYAYSGSTSVTYIVVYTLRRLGAQKRRRVYVFYGIKNLKKKHATLHIQQYNTNNNNDDKTSENFLPVKQMLLVLYGYTDCVVHTHTHTHISYIHIHTQR